MAAMIRNLLRVVVAKTNQPIRNFNRAQCSGFDSSLKLEATKYLLNYQNLADSDKVSYLSTVPNIPADLICHSLSSLKGSLLLAMSLRKSVLQLLRAPDANSACAYWTRYLW